VFYFCRPQVIETITSGEKMEGTMKIKKSFNLVFSLSTITLSTLMLFVIDFQQSRAAGPWYVAPSGDDTNNCLSSTTPCATINGAMGKPTFANGDTILVATGVYTGTGDAVVSFTTETTAILKGGWDLTFMVQDGYSTIDGEEGRTGIEILYEDWFFNTATIEKFVVKNCTGSGIVAKGDLILNDSIVKDNAGENGGGIQNRLSLTLNNSSVRGNKADINGGGISNHGYVELNNSTVRDNQAGENGGGIETDASALMVNNSTISGNSAKDYGGGVYINAIPVKSSRWINFSSSTVSNNSASEGGGIYQEESEPYPFARSTFVDEFQNTILAGNKDEKGSPNCFGYYFSSGYNLIGDISGCGTFLENGDITDTDPILLPLEGSPSYHPLYRFSPAIDAGNPNGCKDHNGKPLDNDQRGIPRKGRCDIGSYEYDSYRNILFPLLFRSD
jgi:hypothetical protein